MTNGINKSVVRNAAYQADSFNVRERHNERKNEDYFNGDIVQERTALNIHFRRHFKEDGSPETYQQTFDRLLAQRTIVKHGTKPNAKLFCEMILDVNTAYFDERGGYEYAKKFYEEAYKLAVKEVGSEDYILSAVMHADERNKGLSEQLGRDVYHYHLHVVYVPVVQKNLYFKKNNKNPELAGKLKEIIPQISNSNKWPRRVYVERNGKQYRVNSYSLLQDRYYEHMKAAGYEGFERGEIGSTAEHLDVLDYKIQQDKKRLGELVEQTEQKRTEAQKLVEATKVLSSISATQREIDTMAKRSKSGKNKIISNADWERVASMAKRYSLLDAKLKDAQRQLEVVKRDRDRWKANYEQLWGEVKLFIKAIRSMPQKILAFIKSNMHKTYEREEL